jgi:hypothetical protein
VVVQRNACCIEELENFGIDPKALVVASDRTIVFLQQLLLFDLAIDKLKGLSRVQRAITGPADPDEEGAAPE